MDDKELQKYFESLVDMFATDGWKMFIEDVTANRETLADVYTINDGNQLFFRRGQLETVDRIINFETTIRNAFEEFERGQDA